MPTNKAVSKSVAKIIARNNEKFRQATRSQKRVLIAREVLAQLKTGRFIAKHGTFLFLDNEDVYADESELHKSLQELFLSKEIKNCSVCALGGLMFGCTILNNKERVGNLDVEFYGLGERIRQNGKLRNGLNTFFSSEQLQLIEIAFENDRGAFRSLSIRNREQAYKAAYFGSNIDDPYDLMVKIMRNIIKNKGEFIP